MTSTPAPSAPAVGGERARGLARAGTFYAAVFILAQVAWLVVWRSSSTGEQWFGVAVVAAGVTTLVGWSAHLAWAVKTLLRPTPAPLALLRAAGGLGAAALAADLALLVLALIVGGGGELGVLVAAAQVVTALPLLLLATGTSRRLLRR